MAERPILFSAPMVRALLAGAKTQTRRVVKPQPAQCDGFGAPPRYDHRRAAMWGGGYPDHGRLVPCPYGAPGDRLWVRETGWQPCEPTPRAWREGADTWPKYAYDADGISEDDASDYRKWGWMRRSAIHMPRWASRITLEITDVRVQRLQDISEADVQAEGCTGSPLGVAADALLFPKLWDSINGAGAWDANPWVWALSFRRL